MVKYKMKINKKTLRITTSFSLILFLMGGIIHFLSGKGFQQNSFGSVLMAISLFTIIICIVWSSILNLKKQEKK